MSNGGIPFPDPNSSSSPVLTFPDLHSDYVLRSASGGSARTVNRPHRSSSILTNPYAAEPLEQLNEDEYVRRAANSLRRPGKTSRYSPSPSVRRGKVAALLREHASPPGVRVTAGGRLVPVGNSPMASPGFDSFAKYENYPTVPHLAPGSVPSQQALTMLEGMIVNAGDGRICQIVNGEWVHVGYTNTRLNLQVPATNPFIPSDFITPLLTHEPFPLTHPATGYSGFSEKVATASDTPGNVSDKKSVQEYESKIAELQAERTKLNRDEVINRQRITPVLRDQIVERRVDLTNQISQLRDKIKSLNGTSTTPQSGQQQPHQYQLQGPPSTHQPMHVSQNAPVHGPATAFMQHGGYEYRMEPSPMPVYPVVPFHAAHSPQFALPDFSGQWGVAANHSQGQLPYYPPQHESYPGLELSERSGNAGVTVGNNMGMKYTTKASSRGTESAGMNLDGSVVQPRRSHAVEIKKPEKTLSAEGSKLNPTSPSYQPNSGSLSNDGGDDPKTAASPGSKNETELQKIARTNKRISKTDPGPAKFTDENESNDDENVSQKVWQASFQASSGGDTSDTANTADFFPIDPQSHSGRHYTYNAEQTSTGNLSNWLKKENESHFAGLHVTPQRSTNKFRFNDNSDSPNEPFQPALNVSGRSSIKSLRHCTDVSAKPPPLNLSMSNWNLGTHKVGDIGPGGSTATSFDSNTHCEAILAQKSSTGPSKSNSKTGPYWDGFRQGIKRELCAFREEEEYRRGYRDGLLRSKDSETSPLSSRQSFATKPVHDADICEERRQSSFSSVKGLRAPSNTPLRQSVENEQAPQGQPGTVSFDRGLFSSSNKTATSVHPAQAGTTTQQSLVRIRSFDQTSPLADRSSRSVVCPPYSASKAQASVARLLSGSGYEQQRYTHKVPTSVASSVAQARAYIPPQYDGSADDKEQDLKETSENLIPKSPKSPTNKGKERSSAPSSPIKRASSAVQKLTQLGGISKRVGSYAAMDDANEGQVGEVKPKKEDDPAKMSSPEKAKWRSKWRKRFEDLKANEQKEIDEYKRTHPPS